MSEVRHPHRLLNSAFSLGLGGERAYGGRVWKARSTAESRHSIPRRTKLTGVLRRIMSCGLFLNVPVMRMGNSPPLT
jgi:hypothetical protein